MADMGYTLRLLFDRAVMSISTTTLIFFGMRMSVVGLLVWQIVRASNARKRAEKAMAAVVDSEARFHAFMNNGPLVGFIKDDSGKIIYVNHKFQEVFPQSACAGSEEGCGDFLPFEREVDVRRDELAMFEGGAGSETTVCFTAPGGPSTWQIVKFPFVAGANRLLGGFAIDVTERERAAEALRESEERFRNTFANAAIGMVVSDSMGRVVQVNPALCRILAYTAAEMEGRDALRFTYPEDRQVTMERWSAAAASGAEPVPFVKRCVRRDGSPVWVEVSLSVVRNSRGDATHFISLVEDISGKKQAEDQARLSEERWHLALEATNDGIWDWDAATNSVYYSARWKQMLGYQESELPNRTDIWDQLVHPDDLARVKGALNDHMANHSAGYEAEYRIRCKDGTYKWILARGKAIRDSEGRAIRLIGAHADITERKRAEEKLFYQASFDSLTGLMNRGYFLSWLEKKIATARSKGLPLFLGLCDIDRFKSINDHYGHQTGDEVLVNLARILQESVRSTDLTGRLGGDEFCVLLSGSDPLQATECLDRIRDRFQTVAFGSAGKGVFRATASFGIAGLRADMDSSALIEAADRALYAAKQRGRNTVAHEHDEPVVSLGLDFPLLETPWKAPQTPTVEAPALINN